MASRPPAQQPRVSPVEPVPLRRPRRSWAPPPTPLTPFVGREREVAAVRALLGRDEVRLVTLTGPGGVGKTRLALRVAEELGGGFRDGVAFVGLAHIRDPDRMPPAIARALGAREVGGRRPEDPLLDLLRGRHLLLLLDNLEQVLDAAPGLARLLAAVPELTILATSRELLRISGEHGFPVPPMSLGSPDAAAPAADRPDLIAGAAASEAVRLFVERARALRPDFALDAANAPIVAEICRRVDGLPLGIELAAARLRHLAPASLLAQMERRLPLLSGGPRDLPDRLRTMRAAIAWSFDLLSPEEQALFRRLAVFAGGFTLPAAAAVAAPPRTEDRGPAPPGIETVSTPPSGRPVAPSVLDLVSSLADKSLLRAEGATGAVPRYGMLETVREFGLERLAESGDAAAVRNRHALWCRRLAAQALTFPLRGTVRPDVLDRLDAEVDNLRAALSWHAHQGEAAALLDLATALTQFWSLRGYRVEGCRWLEDGLAIADVRQLPPTLLAAAFHAAAALARTQRDQARAIELAEEALARFRALGDRWNTANAIHLLGILERSRGAYERAALLHGEALALFRDLGEPFWVALATCDLGILAHWRGDDQQAVVLLEDAVAGFRALDDPWGVGIALGLLALVVGDAGDRDRAAAMHAAALVRLRQVGSKEALVDAVARVATLAAATGRAATAARLLGTVEALGQALGYAVERPEQIRYARAAATARDALGDEAVATAWAEGRALSLEQAVAAALDVVSAPALAASAPVDLTQREVEVLRLLAAGLSNREIADRLFISPATAARHVANLFAKLGVDSRAKATAHAHQYGFA